MKICLGIVALGLVVSQSGCWNPCDGHWKYDPPLPQCVKSNANQQGAHPTSNKNQSTPPAESGPASQPSTN